MFVEAITPAIAASAMGLHGIGENVMTSDAAGAFPTIGVVAPAPDPTAEVTTAFFASHGTLYQGIAAEAAAIHAEFVATMGISAASYSVAEAANALAVL